MIKPNNVSTVNQLAATHADALRGKLDYLERRFKGEVIIAESSAGNTMEGFENFKYTRLPGEYKSLKVRLVDLNEEARYEVCPFSMRTCIFNRYGSRPGCSTRMHSSCARRR